MKLHVMLTPMMRSHDVLLVVPAGNVRIDHVRIVDNKVQTPEFGDDGVCGGIDSSLVCDVGFLSLLRRISQPRRGDLAHGNIVAGRTECLDNDAT